MFLGKIGFTIVFQMMKFLMFLRGLKSGYSRRYAKAFLQLIFEFDAAFQIPSHSPVGFDKDRGKRRGDGHFLSVKL